MGLYAGWQSLAGMLGINVRTGTSPRPYCIGIDGYVGVDWDCVSACVKQALETADGVESVSIISTAGYVKTEKELSSVYARYIENGDPLFGKVFRGGLKHLFSAERARDLRGGITSARKKLGGRSVVVCIGAGALLPAYSDLYDYRIYLDMTREKSSRSNTLIGRSGSIVSSSKRTYYIDFPAYDWHRKRVVKKADMYADGSTANSPIFIPQRTLRYVLDAISTIPFRAKPIYESGIWGGQWLIRQRGVEGLENCAYGLELIAPEQSVLVRTGQITLDLPFNLIKDSCMSNLMEKRTIRKFHGDFPIRFAYDDTWGGGNLSIQVHPTTGYIKAQFGERLHQAETYYMLDAKQGSIVHLGLQEGIDEEEFRSEMRRSERENAVLDYTEFVQVHDAKKGDLFLIPPGTVHGAGANEIVLEISTTPYRYTFKIYDYRRSDLSGPSRALSLQHAFKVIKYFRKGIWVKENLIAKPMLLRSGKGFAEYSLLDRREFQHAITRVEFDARYDDSTRDGFHILNLVEGEFAAVRRKGDDRNIRTFAFSETVLIPHAFGDYDIVNLGTKRCAVLKSLVR